MTRFIANENTYLGFAPTLDGVTTDADPLAVSTADITGAEDLTCFAMSVNAATQGNTLPTPDLCTLFETTINGTVSGSFSADFYRDNENDTAWNTLARGTQGYMIIRRYKDVGDPDAVPAAADEVEVWPVIVTSRTAGPIGNNQVSMFTVTCAVWREPDEAAAVGA